MAAMITAGWSATIIKEIIYQNLWISFLRTFSTLWAMVTNVTIADETLSSEVTYCFSFYIECKSLYSMCWYLLKSIWFWLIYCRGEIMANAIIPTRPNGSMILFRPKIVRVSCIKIWKLHDHVIKWGHFPRYWPFVRGILRSPVNSPHKGQWRGAFIFSLICAWINGWVNNREAAGDLKRHHAYYNFTVMRHARHSFRDKQGHKQYYK